MSEPKPFASLSSGLLARKGAARPAMRPQGFGQSGGGLEDLGWNDMGFEAPKPAAAPRDEEHDAFGEEIVEHPRALHPSGLTPVDSPVHGQQAEIADRLGGGGVEAEGEDEVQAEVEDEAASDVDEEYDDTAELYEPEVVEAPSHPAKKMQIQFADAPVEDVVEPPVAEAAPAYTPRRSTKPRSAPGTKDKAAFTLRLDQSRHLRLRLACAVHGRSAQMIVTDALDQLLAAMPELDAMAENAHRKGT